jgi:hypothetical protein
MKGVNENKIHKSKWRRRETRADYLKSGTVSLSEAEQKLTSRILLQNIIKLL